ncbi:RluA family pseudouridine synthase [Mongoliimonas terrestris]|uniref:RluA family pseudouridine synthase n=1 Tax=Mongoliimonas terrestris TaxID=1709001 RepID=UPI000B0A6AAF|nr:RluA family pseudouridine synthase [Mongoliimonas terrestris]
MTGDESDGRDRPDDDHADRPETASAATSGDNGLQDGYKADDMAATDGDIDLVDDDSSLALAAETLTGVFGPEAAGQRLDKALAGLFPAVSRSRLKSLVEQGHLTLDGTAVADPSRKAKAGIAVVLDLPPAEPAEPEPEDIPLTVVYEDEHLIVIDKPAGLVVHPGAGNWTGTLVNALLFHCKDSLSGIGGVRRPGIVHRLDKDTTGLMVVAKTDKAHKGLAAQFADHGRTGPLERAYLALVWGSPEPYRGTIDAPLGRSPTDRTRIAVVKSGGREAVTHYEVVERYPEKAGRAAVASLVECHLETGRTHQIRVHMAAAGHPLIGDPEYGRGFLTKINTLADEVAAVVRPFPRQALHARLLAFEHPVDQELLRFESDLPEDLEALVEAFRTL